jgi:hypothetical protein
VQKSSQLLLLILLHSFSFITSPRHSLKLHARDRHKQHNINKNKK